MKFLFTLFLTLALMLANVQAGSKVDALKELFADNPTLFTGQEKADLLSKAVDGSEVALQAAFAGAILDGTNGVVPTVAKFTASTKATTVPTAINQIGLDTDTKTLWISTGTAAGNWASIDGQRAGNATLVAGTVTVSNTTVTANTAILHSVKTVGGTPGVVGYSVVSGTSFTLTSSTNADTSVITYKLIELNP